MSDDSARERYEEHLKTPYPREGEVWSALLDAFAAEIEELEEAIDEVEQSKFVDDADGEQLDKLATIFDRERQTGESDSRYRIRVQTALRELLGDGTIDEVKGAISVLLDDDREDIVVEEPYDVEPARMDISVWEESLNNRDVEVEEFDEFVAGLAATGVTVETLALGTFMHATEGEDPTEDGEKRGYASIEDPETGGTYASLLQ